MFSLYLHVKEEDIRIYDGLCVKQLPLKKHSYGGKITVSELTPPMFRTPIEASYFTVILSSFLETRWHPSTLGLWSTRSSILWSQIEGDLVYFSHQTSDDTTFFPITFLDTRVSFSKPPTYLFTHHLFFQLHDYICTSSIILPQITCQFTTVFNPSAACP